MNALFFALFLLLPPAPQYSPRGVVVTGRVTTRQGTFQPTFIQSVTLSRESLKGPGTTPSSSVADSNAIEVEVKKDGTFEFRSINPGTYTLRTLPITPGVSPYSLEVARQNIRDIEMVVPFQMEVNGRIANLTHTGGIHPVVQADQGTFTMATIALDDGSFKLRLSEGANRILVSRLPPNVSVKSIMFGDLDVLKSPLSIDGATLSQPMIVNLETTVPEALPAVTAKTALIP